MSSDSSMQGAGEIVTTLSFDQEEQCADRIAGCIGYDAPWLVVRLCQHGIATNEAQANALFLELKRYLLLAHRQGERVVPMFSSRIDEVWHQFILFTAEYASFCERHFGHYLHHVPEQSTLLSKLPQSPEHRLRVLSFEQFESEYERAFGALSELWLDATAVCVTSRVTHGVEGLYCREGREGVELVRAVDEQVVCRVGPRAANAMAFIARTPVFMVRELPDLNGDDERVKLLRPLVQYGALRLKY